MQTNGLEQRIEGGALCAACRSPRPFAELLAFVRLEDVGREEPRIGYVCRPSLCDLRLPLCTSRALGSVAVHAITLATDLDRLRRQARRPHHERPALPEHVRQYAAAAPA